jgi:hypothetical protein
MEETSELLQTYIIFLYKILAKKLNLHYITAKSMIYIQEKQVFYNVKIYFYR